MKTFLKLAGVIVCAAVFFAFIDGWSVFERCAICGILAVIYLLHQAERQAQIRHEVLIYRLDSMRHRND